MTAGTTKDRPTAHRSAVHLRRSRGRWRLIAAVAALAASGGAFVAAAGGGGEQTQIPTITPTPTTSPTAVQSSTTGPLEPGARSSVDPDDDPSTPLRVTFRAPTEGWGRWGGGRWFGAVKYVGGDVDGYTGLSVTTVTNLVTDGCRDHTPLDPPVGPTVDDLATALSRLAPFEVTAPPTDVTIFGYDGKHLELAVPDLPVTGGGTASSSSNVAKFTGCVEGELHSWISPLNDHSSAGLLGHSTGFIPGTYNAYQVPGQTEEFWILEVGGTRVVLVSFDSPASPADDITERDAIFDSIRIEP